MIPKNLELANYVCAEVNGKRMIMVTIFNTKSGEAISAYKHGRKEGLYMAGGYGI
jgi:hypothetical protein